MEWQYHLLKEIFQKFGDQAKSISTLSAEDILAYKKPYLPESLYKFYAPTVENLSDVANQRLWLPSEGYDNLDTYHGDPCMTIGLTATITRTRASCRISLTRPTSTNLLIT